MDFLFSQRIKGEPVALGLLGYFWPFLNIIRKNILKTEIWVLSTCFVFKVNIKLDCYCAFKVNIGLQNTVRKRACR